MPLIRLILAFGLLFFALRRRSASSPVRRPPAESCDRCGARHRYPGPDLFRFRHHGYRCVSCLYHRASSGDASRSTFDTQTETIQYRTCGRM